MHVWSSVVCCRWYLWDDNRSKLLAGNGTNDLSLHGDLALFMIAGGRGFESTVRAAGTLLIGSTRARDVAHYLGDLLSLDALLSLVASC